MKQQPALFNDRWLRDVLNERLVEVLGEADRLPLAAIGDIDLVVDTLGARFKLQPLALRDADKTATKEEMRVDARKFPESFHVWPGDDPYVPGTRWRISVPFDGAALLFQFKPNAHSSVLPHADVVPSGENGGAMIIDVEVPDAPNVDAADTIKKRVDRNVALARQYADAQRVQVDEFNRTVDARLRGAVEDRKRRAAQSDDVLKSLGIPLAVPAVAAPSAPPLSGPPLTAKAARTIGGEGSYDVALSFAGENRGYVDRVATVLRENGVAVFYDAFEEVDLWGKDLYAHLNEVYRDKARYCVMFLSEHYARKAWTNHERRAAQARAFTDTREYILPARFDDTEIPGINTTVGYIDLRTRTPEEFAQLVLEKLGKGSDQQSTAAARPDSDPALSLPGYASPYFATEDDGETCVLSGARVLIFAGSIAGMRDFLPILEATAKAGRPLLVVAQSVTGEALATLIENKGRGILSSCVIALGSGAEAPGLRRALARLSGARIFGDEAGLALASASLNDLGSADHVRATASASRVSAGSKNTAGR